MVLDYHEERPGFWRRLMRGHGAARADAEPEFLAVVAHETAHHVLTPAPAKDLEPRSEAQAAEAVSDHAAYIGCARDFGRLSEVARPRERAEHEAVALATAWGFPGSGERCALNARRALLHEVANLPPIEGDAP